MNTVAESYKQLLRWLEEQDRYGWDPYDGLNTRYACLTRTKFLRLCCQYIHKFSPVNLRSILGVRKSRQLQAEAFIGLALMRHPAIESADEILAEIAGELKGSSMKEMCGYDCWDPHGFPIQMRTGYTPAGTTDVVGNEACGRFLYEYGAKFGDEEATAMAESAADYMVDKLLVDHGNSVFFRYKPITPEWACTYNASLLAAAYVMDIKSAKVSDGLRHILDECFQFVCRKQKPEGYWFYSIDLRTGVEKHQVDFHQGFILDCLLRYMQVNGFEEPYLSAYKKGLAFYREHQFLPSGQGIYRWPRKWPVNIHNQAQGIITFSRAGELGSGFSEFAGRIAHWTIANMQSPDGYFYFLKYPLFKNKIPYIRWSDAAMSYALAIFQETPEMATRDASERS